MKLVQIIIRTMRKYLKSFTKFPTCIFVLFLPFVLPSSHYTHTKYTQALDNVIKHHKIILYNSFVYVNEEIL